MIICSSQHPYIFAFRLFCMEESFECQACHRQFSSKGALNRHMRNFDHHSQNESEEAPFCCWFCSTHHVSVAAVERHLSLAHAFLLRCTTIEFGSEEAFLEWKGRIERFPYVVYRGARHLPDGSLRKYYTCPHSSLYRRERNTWYCPSRVTAVVHPDGRVVAEWVSTHIPHDTDDLSGQSLRAQILRELDRLREQTMHAETRNLPEMLQKLSAINKSAPLQDEGDSTAAQIDQISLGEFMELCGVDGMVNILGYPHSTLDSPE